MEDLLDCLFEVFFEIIVDGALDAASNRRVPLPFRILAAVIVVGLFGGIVFLMIFGGIRCLSDEELTNGVVLAVILFAFAAFIAGVLVWKFIKAYKSRSKNYPEK